MNKKTVTWLIVVALGLCVLVALIGGGILVFGQGGQASQAPAPVVQIFYPPAQTEVPFGSVIPIGIEASVPEGNQVTRLELWADGELIGEMAGNAVTLTASWGWLPAHASQHVLVGRAFNQEGGQGHVIISIEVQQNLPDSDQDGVADGQDACPQEIGAPEWNGCPPQGAGVIGEAWGPGGVLADDALDIIEEVLAEGEGEGPPSEDPPVVEPEPDPPPPPPMSLLEVEALNLNSAVGARDVYCYLTLTSRPLERVPSDAEGNFTELAPGTWNIVDFMGGLKGRMVDVPEVGPLHMEVDCWGHFSDDPLDPDVRHMGIFTADHGPGDWDGREFIGHGAMDANWFDLTYRICHVSCEETTLPAPYNLTLTFVGPHYELSWQWDEDPSVDNSDVGFHVYRDGIPILTVPDNHPLNVIALLSGEVEPPLCDQEYRFEVRAYRGADIQLSNPSNIAWAISPDPCVGDNRVALLATIPSQNSALALALEHYYIGDHTERVMVGAYPLIDGSPADAFLFTWNGVSVGTGGGSILSNIYYGGTEPISTNGLRLFMLTVHDGIDPGGVMVYSRDVAFDFTWQPGIPDLRITRVYYPEGDDILRLAVRNSGLASLNNWEPSFGFFQEVAGVRTRVDALNSPPGLPLQSIMVGTTNIVSWPGWVPANFALLEPQYEIQVDPDNLIAETNEENNIFVDSKPNVQVTLEKLRVLSYANSDAAGFPGCFVGLRGFVRVGGVWQDQLYFSGDGKKMTYPTFFDWARPHELGLLVCPPQEFDLETELIPVLNAGSCTAACSSYFGAHAQPVFAEGKHPPALPIPGWGTDYCAACYTLAGQTSVNKESQVFEYGYAGGNLEIRTRLNNSNIYANSTWSFDTVCDFTGEIPALDMAALPVMNRTLTDPGGACEIVVSVEPFP